MCLPVVYQSLFCERTRAKNAGSAIRNAESARFRYAPTGACGCRRYRRGARDRRVAIAAEAAGAVREQQHSCGHRRAPRTRGAAGTAGGGRQQQRQQQRQRQHRRGQQQQHRRPHGPAHGARIQGGAAQRASEVRPLRQQRLPARGRAALPLRLRLAARRRAAWRFLAPGARADAGRDLERQGQESRACRRLR